jgi:hypothetical protein
MTLPSPNLDDRNFQQLVDDATQRIKSTCSDWDTSPSNPGTVLIEAFAHLTEVMLYRLNRLPEKAYIEFLRLLGVKLHPPQCARAVLQFVLEAPREQEFEIRAGTRVTTGGRTGSVEAPVFVTTSDLVFEPGVTSKTVQALHCELVQAELAGLGTGRPGQFVIAKRAPIIASTGDDGDLIVGVEVGTDRSSERARSMQYDGKTFQIWQEVENFTTAGGDSPVYRADRFTGRITFSPALQLSNSHEEQPRTLAQVPPLGREIRLWYRRGGGSEGNLAADKLTILKDQIPGVSVTNPGPAKGGSASESLPNAMVRGPLEFRTPQRAITAIDFERFAMIDGVARAKAFTQKSMWVHAQPGAVEVRILNDVSEEFRDNYGAVSVEKLLEFQSEVDRASIEHILDERRPLGTTCLVAWARCKAVIAEAYVKLYPGTDREAVKSRILQSLHRTINPLPSLTASPPYNGWEFGQPLRASNLYHIILREPEVDYVQSLKFVVQDAPQEKVECLAADPFQASTWYACSGDALFRSTNDGDGWEVVARFPGERLLKVETMPGRPDLFQSGRPGMLGIATELQGDSGGYQVHVSTDCGETWQPSWGLMTSRIYDLAWVARDGVPTLMVATQDGLFDVRQGSSYNPKEVLPEKQSCGFYAVASGVDASGASCIAVAATELRGVYLSVNQRPFQFIGNRGDDIHTLQFQTDGLRTFLWAGRWAEKEQPGNGCLRWEITTGNGVAESRRDFSDNWTGGSCMAIAFHQAVAFAATRRAGVLWLDTAAKESSWTGPDIATSKLPLEDKGGRLRSIAAIAVDPQSGLLFASSESSIYKSKNVGKTYENCSQSELTDRVTLPESWLFCSGEHVINFVDNEQVVDSGSVPVANPKTNG